VGSLDEELLRYLAEFFQKWKIVSDKSCTKKWKLLFRKSSHLWNNVEKYDTARQATDDSMTRRMLFPCWINKATDTHSEYVILTAFPQQQWFGERLSLCDSRESRNFFTLRNGAAGFYNGDGTCLLRGTNRICLLLCLRFSVTAICTGFTFRLSIPFIHLTRMSKGGGTILQYITRKNNFVLRLNPLHSARYFEYVRSDPGNRSGDHYLCEENCLFLKTILSIAGKPGTWHHVSCSWHSSFTNNTLHAPAIWRHSFRKR
jgi:hypothetical protein